MIVSIHMKITMTAVVTALVVSGCGAGGDTVGVSRSGAATSSSAARSSNLQDMRDLYALKRQVAALRREQPGDSGPGCDGL